MNVIRSGTAPFTLTGISPAANRTTRNAGCFGVAVIAVDRPMEVQFDEHKTLVCYARDLKPFVDVLHAAELPQRNDLRLVSDAPHLHYSLPEYAQQFGELAWRLGVGEGLPQVMGS